MTRSAAARRIEPPRLGVGDQNQRAAANERLGEGGDTWWGSRVRLREKAAAVGDEAPDGGRSPQLALGHAPGSARSSAPGGSHGRERVRLGPDLDADVVDAGRQRVGEAHAQRQQRAGQDRQVVGRAPPTRSSASGPHTTASGARVVRAGHDQADRPGGAEEHRTEPVRRQVDAQALAALEVVLLDEQAGGLRDPVGVRRHRQLDPLAGRVVVEGDQRAGRRRRAAGGSGPRRRSCTPTRLPACPRSTTSGP